MNKIERAIESTKNRIHYITVNSKDGTPSYCVKAEKQVEIQNVILDALEKQKPKKPTDTWKNDIKRQRHHLCRWACPDCGTFLGFENKHCTECGTKIKWDAIA